MIAKYLFQSLHHLQELSSYDHQSSGEFQLLPIKNLKQECDRVIQRIGTSWFSFDRRNGVNVVDDENDDEVLTHIRDQGDVQNRGSTTEDTFWYVGKY